MMLHSNVVWRRQSDDGTSDRREKEKIRHWVWVWIWGQGPLMKIFKLQAPACNLKLGGGYTADGLRGAKTVLVVAMVLGMLEVRTRVGVVVWVVVVLSVLL